MITVVILTNLSIVFAFLAGATTDISALILPSTGKSKIFMAMTAICSVFVILATYHSIYR